MTTGKYELVIKWPSGQGTLCGEMTDHQHGEICRILSPDYRAQLPSQGGEPVAWLWYEQANEFNGYEGKQRISLTKPKGRCQPLYTHPADQVAEPDAELVELLRSKFPRIDPCQPVPLDEKAHCCEYTIYVERERLHRMIDAKLATLEVKS